MTVRETDLPNVGRKYELDLAAGGRLSVVIDHDGTRTLYRQPAGDGDAERVAELTGEEARQFGAVLGGAYFQPAESETADVPVGDARIEWFDVTDDSPLAGNSVGASTIGESGATLLAIQRGSDTIANPGDEEVIESGDVLVTLGTRAEQRDLEATVNKDSDA
ncbi:MULTISPECIES: cation:proton antiporter regulatory subunit [Halobacterium]|uniref:cation:proton antiporter regulatory subunit n=1 Tax=Halobacterium TaxID=2239 RepID=UPI00073F3CAE|nr:MULTISPECIES: TrkA C-terminal domain-containing protein [Halobacterium]MCG1003444.1 cation:proton antiporter regulatory subunit [Halobacterium noricense]